MTLQSRQSIYEDALIGGFEIYKAAKNLTDLSSISVREVLNYQETQWFMEGKADAFVAWVGRDGVAGVQAHLDDEYVSGVPHSAADAMTMLGTAQPLGQAVTDWIQATLMTDNADGTFTGAPERVWSKTNGGYTYPALTAQQTTDLKALLAPLRDTLAPLAA